MRVAALLGMSIALSASAVANTGPTPDAVSSAERIADRAAISKINEECVWRAWSINDRADVDIRGTETVRLRSEATSSADHAAGPPRDNGNVRQLADAENRRTATVIVQRTDLKHLRKECDNRRAAELKRQADRNAARVEAES